MVDVESAARDVVDRSDAGADHVRDAADDQARREKADRREKEALPSPALKMKVIEAPHEGGESLAFAGLGRRDDR
jgi:hypothetical protein